MIKKVVHNKGGLHGRLTQTLRLLPFTLAETRLFLAAQQVNLPAPQLIEFYMAVGGVATYLNRLQRGRSLNQLIQSRYFDADAPLKGELSKLFSSLFDHHERHLAIVEALAASHYGLTLDALLKKNRVPQRRGIQHPDDGADGVGFLKLPAAIGQQEESRQILPY